MKILTRCSKPVQPKPPGHDFTVIKPFAEHVVHIQPNTVFRAQSYSDDSREGFDLYLCVFYDNKRGLVLLEHGTGYSNPRGTWLCTIKILDKAYLVTGEDE